MKEIGGYFELEGDYIDNSYHKKAIALNTATNGLIYLIKSKNIKKIYLPYYLCDCLEKIKPYCLVEYYKINKDFTPSFNVELKDNEYLYIINYFGIFDNYAIKKYKKIYKNIIIDNVQAFFQRPVKGIDTIYSCRKFFGVPDGAYLYTDCLLNHEIPIDKSKNRFMHLLGRLEEDASTNYNLYKENEELLSKLELAYMSKATKTILNNIKYNLVRNKRTENFNYLNEHLNNINKLKINSISGAYAYPLYLEKNVQIRKRLIENKIYIPILWPNVLTENNEDSIEYKYANNILPIPCDQRYGTEDMKKIIKLIIGEKNT